MSAPSRQAITVAGEHPLVGYLDLPVAAGPAPVVVACHGFKGFCDWGFFPPLADLLVARGVAVVRVNLHSSGMRLGGDRVDDLEAFRRQTVRGELADLLAVLAAVPTLAPGRVDADRVALFGHSRGGGLALLAAATPPWRDRLRALVTWAAIGTFERLPAEERERWRQTGAWTVVNARTGQELPIGTELLDDVESHRADYDLAAAAARRRAPWLLVHGEDDATVPVAEGESLFAAAQPYTGHAPTVELLRVPAADHTFGARHPFAGPNPGLIAALNATQTWLLRHLRD